MADGQTTWRFPAASRIADSIELFERTARYGPFTTPAVFLTRAAGFTAIDLPAFAALPVFHRVTRRMGSRRVHGG